MVSQPSLLIVNAAAALYMTGLIWFVQVVHYPLYARVGDAGFREYEREHSLLTGRVVALPMLIELATALPLRLSGVETALSLGLLGAIWVSTAVIQVPCHNRLVQGFDETTLRRLVQSNWIRTAAWTLRSLLLGNILLERLRSAHTP